MTQQTITSQRLQQQYLHIQHKSGLELLLCPMPGYSTAYAMFGTKYGSIDNCFKVNDEKEFLTVPDGIAHYLEHKLFESEDGDAFARYAATGASANAFTAFDRTAYLFSCAGESFPQALEILLDFVTHPYFTEQTVQKEQGIIGQEIRMYDDSADWRVLFNCLDGMYHNNPVKVDIAGTVESIAQINADLLYACYHKFYNLHNMVLTVAGNFSVDTVLQLADRILKPAPPMTIERFSRPEPRQVVRSRTVQKLPVAVPMFQIGLKGVPLSERENFCMQIIDEMLLEVLMGESSQLYGQLYKQGLINATFSTEAFSGRDYCALFFAGESRDPQQVYERICARIDQVKQQGIDPQDFAHAKKVVYGRYIGIFDKVEAVSSLLMLTHFAGLSMYEVIELAAQASCQQLEERLASCWDTNYSTLSIVEPVEG